jgi:hypothetical protein
VVVGYGAPDQPCPECGGDGLMTDVREPARIFAADGVSWAVGDCDACEGRGTIPVEFPFTAAITIPCPDGDHGYDGGLLVDVPGESGTSWIDCPTCQAESRNEAWVLTGCVCTVTRWDDNGDGGFTVFLEGVRPT